MPSSLSGLVAKAGFGVEAVLRLSHRDGQRVLFRVRPRLLVRRPRPGHRLPADLEVVDQLGPRPDRRALPRFRRVLHQFETGGDYPGCARWTRSALIAPT